MKLNKAMEGYKLTVLSRGYSPTTLVRYEGCLKLLSERLGNPEIQKITSRDLEAFMAWLTTGYKPFRFSGDNSPLLNSSKDSYWRAIRSFFNWASDEFKFQRPDDRLVRPQFQSKPFKPFSRTEVAQIIQACKVTAGTQHKQKRHTAKRDQSIVMTLLDTGMRRGELLRLTMTDLSVDENTKTYIIRIRPYNSGRKSKARFVYCGKAASRYLWRYLAEREDLYEDDWVFP